jgi:hypothetical protein
MFGGKTGDPLCQFNLSLHTFELTRNIYMSCLAHCYLFHLFLHNNDVSGSSEQQQLYHETSQRFVVEILFTIDVNLTEHFVTASEVAGGHTLPF